MYLRTMLFELLFLAIVIFGVRLRGVSLETIFGQRWRSFGAVLRDLGLGIALILVSTIVVSLVGVRPAFDFQSIHSIPASAILARNGSLGRPFDHCRHLRRSRLPRLFSAPVRRTHPQRPRRNSLVGAAFGAAHLYQGWRRAVPIAVMGALFGFVAQWRGTVRPGMFAHVIQDSVAPLLVKLIHH